MPARRIRVAVVGCGAVARQIHLPVLAGHPEVELAALVDPDLGRRTTLARAYGVQQLYAQADGLGPGSVDAALVCTPASSHEPIARALAQRGIHLLVEKPLASSARAAEDLVQAAEAAGVVLAVGLYRRLLPSARLAKTTLESQWLGRPLSIDHREGADYAWPASTLSSMSRELAGGGVLIDCGSHVLDQLVYLLGAEARVVEYRHNAAGGVESDCRLALEFSRQGQVIPVTLELSRTRKLRNTLRIQCERATLELDERQRLQVHPAELPGDFELRLGWAAQQESPWHEPFRVQLDDFLSAIRERRSPELSGRSALASMRLIDDCYRSAGELEQPGLALPAVVSSSAPRGPRRVLVTGASGFVGCRAAELLARQYGWQVRAALHTPAHASRLATLPVEMVVADLRRPEDARRLVAECDAIVHCAMGNHAGPRRELFAVTVDGTRHLAEAARAAGVARFVQISTIAVHGLSPGITLDASAPLRPAPGDEYAASKAAAERAVQREAARGLAAVILRPTRIYGPFSQSMIVGPLENLRRGRLAISREAVDAPAQMMFVDNAVAAIVCALEAPAAAVSGRAFLVSDGEAGSCDEFYRFFADAAGLELPIVDDRPANGESSELAAWSRGLAELARSPELSAAFNRLLETDRPGRLLREALDAAPRLKQLVRRGLGLQPFRYERRSAPDPEIEIVRPREKRICLEPAQQVLGYRPIVPLQEALHKTLAWVRYAEILPG